MKNALWWAVFFFAVIFMLLLAGCGSGESYNERDDRHFHECIDAGGSYKQGDGPAWSCSLPAGAPSPRG